jgi:hypothetical protein
VGAPVDPTDPISPGTIRKTAEALPDSGSVSPDQIRQTAKQLPDAGSVSPDQIRSTAQQLGDDEEQLAQDDGGFFDDLKALAFVAQAADETVARGVADAYQEGGIEEVVRRGQEAAGRIGSEMAKKFYRGLGQESLDRARYILDVAQQTQEDRAAASPLVGPRPKPFEEAPKEAAQRAIEHAQKRLGQAQEYEGAPSIQKFTRQLEAGNTGRAAQTAIENPAFLPALGLGTLAQQPDALAASAGLTAAAGLVAPAGVPAMLAASGAGAGSGFLSAGIVESRAELAKSLRESGADLSDTEQVMRRLQDPDFREEVQGRTNKRVAAIGSVDALANLATLGMARGGLSRTMTAVLSAGGETLTEGLGEGAAQLATERPVEPAEVALESLAGFVPGTIEAGTQLAAGGTAQDGTAQDGAVATESVRERIQRAREAAQGDGAPQVERPLRDMEESDLRNARDRALETSDQPTVDLIDEELELREQEEAQKTETDTQETEGQPQDPESDAVGVQGTPASDEGSRSRPEQPSISEPAGDAARPETPQETQASQRSRRALQEIERARRVAERSRRAREQLGLGQIPEDPAPDVDARRQPDEQPDEQDPERDEQAGERRDREASDEGVSEGDAEDAGAQPSARDVEDPDEAGTGASAAQTPLPDAAPGATEGRASQGELGEDMGLRPETRPEEQVGEAVEEAAGRVRDAEEQVQEMRQQVESAVSDADAETVQRLAEQTESQRVQQLLQQELERRGGTESLFEEERQQGSGQGQADGLFGREAESTSGLERLVRQMEQREAGLEQARAELLERRQTEAERREQARDAQQGLGLAETEEVEGEGTNVDVAPEEARDLSTNELAEIGEEAAANDNADQEQVILDELQRRREAAESVGAQYRPPAGEEPGRLALEGTQEGQPLVEATVTEEAVQAPRGTAPETLQRLADEAGRRGKALETSDQVDPETAQALFRLAEEGYEVRRAGSATQTETGVQADSEPAFRIEAPKVDETAPSVRTDQGVRMGRASRPVTREMAQDPRSDAFADTPTEELEERRNEAVEEDNGQQARRIQKEIARRENPPTRTIYRHSEGDLVAVDEDGRFIDRRAGEKYEEALAQYFAESEDALREGTVEPGRRGDYAEAVARGSTSPQQVLEAYNMQRGRVGDQAFDPVEDQIDSNRYDTSSFDEHADPNWRQDSGQVTMNWLGGETSLDAAARTISKNTGREVTPQDIVEHIMGNPAGPNRKSEPEQLQEALADRFRELTGVRLTPDLADRLQDAQRIRLSDEQEQRANEDPQLDEDDPFTPPNAPFKRMEQAAEERGSRAPASALVEVYLRLEAANLGGAEVTVVNDASELEGETARQYNAGQKRAGEKAVQPAMFLGRPDGPSEVFIVASELEASARAMGADLKVMSRATMMHEVVTHKGLRDLLGGEFRPMMVDLFDAIGRGRLLSAQTADGTPLADVYAPELEIENGELTTESKVKLVEEYLALLSEGMATPDSLYRRIARRIKNALRRVFGTGITDAELRLLLEASRDHLRGRQARNGTSGTRFSRRASRSVPTARWMMLGTDAESFQQAQEEGRTFQGPDFVTRFEISDAEATFAADGPIRNLVEGQRERDRLRREQEKTPGEEFADEAAAQIEDAHKKFTSGFATLENGAPLGDVLAHDRLFEEYPDLQNIQVEMRDMRDGALGTFSEKFVGGAQNGTIQRFIMLNKGKLLDAASATKERAATILEDVMKTLLHEIQHAIQRQTGFKQGSSPNAMQHRAKRELQQAQDEYRLFIRSRDALSVARRVQDGMDLDTAIEEQVLLAETDEARTLPVDQDLVREAVQSQSVAEIEDRHAEKRAELEDLGFNPNIVSDQQALEDAGSASQLWLQDRTFDLYRRQFGEVEARLTGERRDVPQEERITSEDEMLREADVGPEEIITRFSRRSETPEQLGLFHDPESGQAAVPGGKRNLVTVHNLDPQNIRFAVDQMDGHLPVPSLATVRYEEGLANFGDITLLGSPDLIDPKDRTPTFAGDAYTPTTPGPAYEGSMDAWVGSDVQQATDKFSAFLDKEIDAGLASYVRNGQRDKFYSMLARSETGMLAFLEEQGETITLQDLPRGEHEGFMADQLKQDALTDFLDSLSDAELNRLPYAAAERNEAYDPQLVADVTDAFKQATEEKVQELDIDSEGRREKMRRVLADVHLGDDGALGFTQLDRLRKSYRALKEERNPVDTQAVKAQAKERVQEVLGVDSFREARQEIESYWRDRIDPFSEPRLPSETSKKYNLYNIVEAMRDRGVRAAEGSGVNFLRALTIERFGTVEEVQRARDRLTSRDEYKQAAARLEGQVDRVKKRLLKEHENWTPNQVGPEATRRVAGIRKSVHRAVADYLARPDGFEHAKDALASEGFESVPADKVHAFMELVTQLQREPVQYFESKPQRAVALSEFEAAIVPDDTPTDVREALQEEVGRVAEYEAGSDAARQQALADESDRADVRFQREKTSEDADETPGDVPPNPNAFTVDWGPSNLIALTKRGFRRWFAQRGLLPESVFDAKMERDGSLDAAMERVRFTLRDFGEALREVFGQSPTAEQVREVNEALQNGYREDLDPTQGELFQPDVKDGEVTRTNPPSLFGSDPPLRPAVKPEEEQTLGDLTFIEDLPGLLQDIVGTMRDQVDALSRMGIKAGLFRGDLKVTVTENLGTYLTRQYKVHQEEDFGAQMRQAVRDADADGIEITEDDIPATLEEMGVEAETWNRAVAAMRDLHPGMSNERILGELFRLIDDPEPGDIYGGGKLGSVGQSIFERRKDIPGPLRELMGQIHDPAKNYMASMHKMLHAVTSQRFLNRVKQAGLGEWLRQEPVVEDGVEYTAQIAAEGSRTMHPLNGLYTTKEIKQAFETFDEHNSGGAIYRTYMTLVGTVKEALTVFSSKLQVRNYTSAFGFGLSQGHLFAGRDYLRAYREAHPTSWNRIFKQEDTEAQREMIQKMQRLNIIDEAPRVGDIEDTWRDAGQLMGDPMEGVDNMAAKITQEVDQGARRAYQAGDNVHKMAGFLIERQRYRDAFPNKSEEQIDQKAAQRIRNTFPTYSLVPKFVRRLRANPFFSSFPSFFAEIVRNRTNTLLAIKEDLSDPRTRRIGIQRAAGETIKASVWAGIMAGGKALTGIGDDEEDLIRRHMPSWERYSYHFFHSRDEEAGTASYVDIGYLNPDATLHEPVMRMLAGEEIDEQSWGHVAAYRFLEPFISPEILTRSAIEAVTNARFEQGTFEGNIYNPELSRRRKIEEGAKHVAKDFVPGTLTQAKQTWQAFAQDPEFGEDPPTKVEAIAEPLTGQNMRTIDFANSLKWKTINVDQKLSDARSLWFTSVVQRGEVTQEDLEEALRNSLNAQQEAIEAAHTDLIGAQVAGVSEERALAILQANGLSKRDAIDVLDGRFRPRPDFNILQGQIQSQRVTGNEQDAQLLEERAELVRKVLREVIPEYRRPNDEAQREVTEERLNQSE